MPVSPMSLVEAKLHHLEQIVFSLKSVVVAFSGGCDSAFILKVARAVLGRDAVLAITTQSVSFPRWEMKDVEDFVSSHDIRHRWIQTHEMENANYRKNPADRCFYCKSELYDELLQIAQSEGFHKVINGTNRDDLSDWRPGLQAAQQRGVCSPLLESGLHKDEIRMLSKQMCLETWDKPAAPCLSSRIPYGQAVTEDKLRQIEAGEAFLKSKGFRIVRLRHYGQRARIEVSPEEFSPFKDQKFRQEIIAGIKSLGFQTVEIDPEGYRQGKLNQTITKS